MEEKNPNLGCELAVKTRSNIRKERALGANRGRSLVLSTDSEKF